MYGTDLLKQRIQESGMKFQKIIKALRIKSYATFRTKVNDPAKFTAREISALSDMLSLTKEDRDRIFFNQEVA